MNAPARLPLSSVEFLAWEERQEEKHEFVRGRIRLMAGATRAHHTIQANALVSLRARLRGKPCQAYIEQRIAVPGGNWRYADVSVDCGAAMGMKDLAAAEPRVVIEVESPSTPFLEEMERVEDYQAVPAIAHVLVLAQDRPRGRLWTRTEAGWTSTDLKDLAATLELPAIDCAIPLAELYEGVVFGG